jgi:hypothetical protein
MRVMPDRCLQLDFQRRAPEPCTIAPTSVRASLALHGAPLTSAPGAWFGSAFSSERETWLRSPLMLRSHYSGGA